ncbi:hypothetical protein ACBP93_04685 [Paenalcaligenes hominis]|uniref:hypothetical protein n=1 Tax=Paenalcaligenes hominis TaxID=643674 RepID=UPI0035244F99
MNTHTTQTTHCFTLQQLRAATQAGGVAGVSLKAQGGGFFIQIQLRTGQNAVLVTARSRSPRMFKNPAQAFGVLKRVGIVTGSFDVTHYSPEQQQTDNDTKKKEKNTVSAKAPRALKKPVPSTPEPAPAVVASVAPVVAPSAPVVQTTPTVELTPVAAAVATPATTPPPAPAAADTKKTPSPKAEPSTSTLGVQQSLI